MANITTQTIRVDLSTGKVIPTAYTHQNDTARTLEFSMYNKGVPYTMTGNTVKFAYKSPIVDGAYTVITGSGMASGTVSGNKVTVALPVAYTRISGVGLLTMIITPSSGTIRPVNIRLVVQKSADGGDEIAGASDFPATLEEIAENWLDENISFQIDDTLSVSGKAADAKVTGDNINEIISHLYTQVTTDDWVGGGVAAGTGNLTTTGLLMRNNDFVGVFNNQYSVEVNSDYALRIFAWDMNNNYIGTWHTDTNSLVAAYPASPVNYFSFINYPNYKFRVTVLKIDGTQTLEEDTANVIFSSGNIGTLLEEMPKNLKWVKTLTSADDLYTTDIGMYRWTATNKPAHVPNDIGAGICVHFGAGTNSSNTTGNCLFVVSSLSQVFTAFQLSGNQWLDWIQLSHTTTTIFHNIIMFGDSITAGRNGDYSAGTHTQFEIPTTINRILGTAVENHGVSGQGWLKPTDSRIAYDEIADTDLTAYDVIILAYGVNDNSYPLGNWDSTDETTIMGQINKCVRYIYNTYPSKQVIIIGPWNHTSYGTFPDYWYGIRTTGGWTYQEFSDTLKTYCENYWIKFIDQHDGPMNGFNITSMIGTDGVHPNNTGYKAIGMWLAGKLNSMIG